MNGQTPTVKAQPASAGCRAEQMTAEARDGDAEKVRQPSTKAGKLTLVPPAGLSALDAAAPSAKNPAMTLTPLDRMLGDLLAAALVKDLLAFPEPRAAAEA